LGNGLTLIAGLAIKGDTTALIPREMLVFCSDGYFSGNLDITCGTKGKYTFLTIKSPFSLFPRFYVSSVF
jgi:hypothetical protein